MTALRREEITVQSRPSDGLMNMRSVMMLLQFIILFGQSHESCEEQESESLHSGRIARGTSSKDLSLHPTSSHSLNFSQSLGTKGKGQTTGNTSGQISPIFTFMLPSFDIRRGQCYEKYGLSASA